MDGFLTDFETFSQSWWPFVITFIITVISAIRIYVGGTYCNSKTRIDGQHVIITGSSSGIGLKTAIELAQRGGNVILAVRNAEKGKKAVETIRALAPHSNVIIKLLDLAEFSSIRDFADQILQEYDQIDILINNAGIIFHPYEKTIDGNEITFQTNYLGPFLLTHLMLPLLAKSDNGRVINISAIAHYNGKLNLDLVLEESFDASDAFAESKLALTMMTKHMASLFKDTKITFNSVSPGLVRNTGHLKSSKLQNSFMTKLSVWPWIWLFLKTPKQGCQSIVYLAVEPTLRNVSGCYFSDCEIKDAAESVNDTELLKQLYEKSCKLTGLNSDEILGNLLAVKTKMEDDF